ncbi:MAG TPA: type IV secretion system DNA-binding domain-containing protein, partial [Methylomirabilota bacterium]|nr:type IV secretion system DNA-binding domain-containing protein [Methylomirabilota bacterium]
AWDALTTGEGDPFFAGEKDMLALAKRKLAAPLFAVVARIGAVAADEKRAWEIIRAVAGVMRLFDSAEGNRLNVLENDGYADDDHRSDLLNRCSRRCGMLLSSDELISIAHLPMAAVRSRKLTRAITRTREVPEPLTLEGVWLGVNKHEGQKRFVRVPDISRTEHMHVIGTQGTGKSTLLLNMICQDIYNGRGCAVLDPHGDLIDEVLAYIPPERYRDVILVDPSDDVYPIGFNILSAHSTIEKNLLASDLVAVFRRLSTSWGDQMNSVLGNAVLAFLENTRVGTLPELRRFFVEPAFRKEMLATVTDPDILYYWEKEFPLLKTNSFGPLLTRLDMFLRPKTIRYMVGQRENKLDFAGIMNEGKILLARLSQGIIGEENGFLLGTLLVSKFHQLAISRQAVESEERRPFFLYIDEFHHFVTPSMASILTGVRKYRLGLILAHQNMTQLRDADVANAVLSSPYTRVCFRVGDQDAKRVAESLAFFESSDILNLGKGEAICRVQKNDWDFNLETIVPPKPEPEQAKQRRQYLHYLTRMQYGMAREKVEEDLAKSRVEPKRERVDPFAKRTEAGSAKKEKLEEPATSRKVAEPLNDQPPPQDEELERIEKFYAKPETQQAPLPKPEATSELRKPTPTDAFTDSKENTRRTVAEMGRGGEQHRTIQKRIKEAAEAHGLRAIIERPIRDGGSHVDIVIECGGAAWACQVATGNNSVDHEFGQIRNSFKAGFENVVVIATKLPFLKKLESAVVVTLGAQTAKHVSYFLPDAFIDEIPKLCVAAPEEPITTKSHGYKVTVETVVLSADETKAREQSALEAYANSIKKKRRKT